MKMLVFAIATVFFLVGIACAAERPELQEGLWSVQMQSISNPGNKKTATAYTLCRDHAYDKKAEALAKRLKSCTMVSESFVDGKYSAETRCTVGGSVIDSKGTSTYQGNTATHSETHATYTPPIYGMSDTAMIMDQKYIGSCPAGAMPGDKTTANGIVTHSRQH